MCMIPLIIFADELPTVLLGEQYYDVSSCTSWKASHCKSYICITSEERDCQEQCFKDAEERCKKEFGVF